MRILFLTDSLSDLDGVGRYTVNLISALQRLRPELEFAVALARKHRPTSAEVPLRWDVRVVLPPDYFFYMSRPRFWLSLVVSWWRLRGMLRGVELVHAIKDYPHNLVGLLAARSRGLPCVATAHGTYSVQPLKSSRHSRLARWAYRRFHALICVSRVTARALREELGRDESTARLSVIPNAVDASRYAAAQKLESRPWHGRLFTLSIGELKERKGHHVYLAAFCALSRQFPDWHHYLIGKRSGDAYERALLDAVATAGCSDRVHLLGNVGEEEKIDLLQRAGLFAHTPVRAADGGFEGFGIVYLEAAACGTPTLGTLGSGAEDAVRDGVDGLLVPARTEEVQKALQTLLSDAALRARLGAAGRERVQGEGWDKNAAAVLELYDAALAGSRGGVRARARSEVRA